MVGVNIAEEEMEGRNSGREGAPDSEPISGRRTTGGSAVASPVPVTTAVTVGSEATCVGVSEPGDRGVGVKGSGDELLVPTVG